MKKVVKIFIFFILLSSFIMPNVYAKELSITKVEVKDKSGTITVEEPVITNNTITSNITFNQINDFVTFSVEVDNQEDIPYALESITANENEYLTFESSDINKTILGLSKEKYSVTIKYNHELLNQEEVNINDISIQLIFKVDNSFINPQTNSSIIFYLKIILFSLMIGSLIVLFKQKAYKLLFACFLLIPFICFAEEGKIITIGFNNIKVKGRFLEYNIVIDLGNGEYQTVSELYGTTIEELPEPEKIGYTFTKWVNEDHEEVSTDSIIEGDMQLIPVFEPITYSINYNLGGGTLSTSNPETYNIETNTFTLNNPTKQGYNFAGWVEEETGELQTSVTIEQGSINNKTYTATFDARDDTSYTVIHQQQNLSDNNYTTVETQHLTGVTDTSVTPQRRSYTGFTAPAGQTVNINADGSTTVTYQYTRNTYTFSISDRTYVTGTANGTYKYGYSISVTAQTRAGYTFKWSDNTTSLTKSFTLSGNTTLSAVYTARTDTAYTVIHQQQNIDDNNYTTVATNTYTGKTDTSVTPSVNSYTGFTSPSTQTKTINGDGSTTFTYQYNRISYTLTLNDSNYITTSTPSGSYRYGKSITLTANTREGYTFTKWSDDYTGSTYTFTLTGDKTIGPIYEANQVNITLNPNGGTLTNTTITKRIGETIGELPTPTPVGNRTFLGWYTALEGGSEVGEDFIVTGAMEIIARWEYHPETTFDTGVNVNIKMKKASGATGSINYSTANTIIEQIKVLDSLPSNFTATENNTVSISASDEPIYIWYDSTNKYLYYYTDAEKIYLNPDSSSMFYCFNNITTIENINSWDASKATEMNYMFFQAGYNVSSFNINISNWNVSNVTSISGMMSYSGYNATTWTIGDLSSWGTSNVTSMQAMFQNAGYNATTWEIGDLSTWNTSKVTSMAYMFDHAGYKATSFNINLSNWNVLNVTSMSGMFYHAGYTSTTWSIGALSSWNVSKVENMTSMFQSAAYKATTFNIGNLSNWNTSKVTNMQSMFYNAGYNATTWTIGDLSSWDTSKVTNMSYMFEYAGYKSTTFNIGNLSTWNVSSVKSMSSMFQYAGYKTTTFNIGTLSNWITSQVTGMNQMFSYAGYNSTTFNLDLSNWDTSKVTTMQEMFNYAGSSSTSWSIGNLSGWNTSNVTKMDTMFSNAGNNATTWTIGDLSTWKTSKVTTMEKMFYHAGYSAQTWSIGNISNWDTSSVTNLSNMFNQAGFKSRSFIIDVSNWNTLKVKKTSAMFYMAGANASEWSIGNLSNWNTSSVTTMSSMFSGAGNRATLFDIGDLSTWNTSNVTDMSTMFCQAGEYATTWNSIGTIKTYASNIKGMFNNCRKAKATLNIYNKPSTFTGNYPNDSIFGSAATDSSALITVNYTSAVDNIDDIIATKSSASNVVKGSLITTS